MPSYEFIAKSEVDSLIDELAPRVDGSKVKDRYTVNSDTVFNGFFLACEELYFPKGAVLRLAPDSEDDIFILAKKITVEDQANPGVIAWEREEKQPDQTHEVGFGAAGADGKGQTGGSGPTGIEGIDGKDAPSLTIFVWEMETSGPRIDLAGQDGGKGGRGGTGGKGGTGGRGKSAKCKNINLGIGSVGVTCKNGPGRGKKGGAGGAGGTGGPGGMGGDGGDFSIFTSSNLASTAQERFSLDLNSGEGGDGGDGGTGGVGGAGGSGGKSSSCCDNKSGSEGSSGARGSSESHGPSGDSGHAGKAYLGLLSQAQWDAVIA